MAKDKKKKKDKKKGFSSGASSFAPGKKLKALADNPLVADVVAAALVATASALKDSNRARQLAASASDELEKLSKKNAERGNVMWQLALDIGRRAVDSVAAEMSGKPAKAAKPAKSGTAKRAKASRTSAGKSAAKKPSRKPAAGNSRAKRS